MRISSLDGMKALAIFCVVVIHVSSAFVNLADESSALWWVSVVMQSAVFWPVPVFVMASGYLLLAPGRDSTASFYKKRLRSTFIPAVIWLAFFFVWDHLVRGYYSSPEDIVKTLMFGHVSDHLYFLFVISGLYFVTPPLRGMLNHQAPPRYLLFFSLAMLAFWVTHVLFNRYLESWARTSASISVWYLGYFLLGYAYRRYEEEGGSPFSQRAALIVVVLAILISTLSKGYEASGTDGYIKYYYANSYFSLLLAPLAVVIFPLMLRSQWVARLGEQAITKVIAQASFGIYLVHMVFIDIWHVIMESFQPFTPWGILIEASAIFLLALVTTLSIQQTPFLRVALGGKNQAFSALMTAMFSKGGRGEKGL